MLVPVWVRSDELVFPVNPNGHGKLGCCAYREAQMIEMRVGQDDGLDIARFTAYLVQGAKQVRPGRRECSIYYHHGRAVFDEIAVDVGVGEAMDAWSDVLGQLGPSPR
jgi:hypothetical protein